MGTGAEPDDSTPAAGEALVFMVVALDCSWKLSIGYFLIDYLNADEKANILTMAFQKLFDVHVKAVNVTCDGPRTNFSVLKKMGANFDPTSLKVTFPHPCDANQNVTVLLDPCHMVKLMRNAFSDLKVLVDPDGKEIKWEFIQSLQCLQGEEGLRAGNKLRLEHIEWHRQKMKVSLAVQTLSLSVANSIDFCRESLKLSQFQGSEATTKFIRTIDALFDAMNSRNPLGKGTKAPMRVNNKEHWSKLFSESFSYLSNLSDLKRTKMVSSHRFTAFLGFLVNIRSLEFLFSSLVEEGPLKYLLTYKLSQDHLELFFCALRCRLGRNNNPSVPEFIAAYKRLLLHQEIKGNRGNCLLQDDTSLLSFQIKKEKVDSQTLCDYSLQQTSGDENLQKNFGLAFEETDHDYAHISRFPILSEFQDSVVEYISGYTVRMASRRISCKVCLAKIVEQNCAMDYKLVKGKDRGGLIYVSASVKIVCKLTEQAIRTVMKTTSGIVPFKNGLCTAITTSVLKSVHDNHK